MDAAVGYFVADIEVSVAKSIAFSRALSWLMIGHQGR